MPLFSVIIPSYNRAELIVRALASVFNQDFRDFEVIVVDDGSTDGTCHAVSCYGDKIQFFRQRNRGPGAARNLGIRQATGEYLAFLDSDDLWFPWTLMSYAAIVREHSPALIAGRLAYFGNEQELQVIARCSLISQKFPDYLAASRRGLYCGSCQLVVRRELALETGGFTEDQGNAEDHDFVLRLGTAPGFVNVQAPALIGYRQHTQSLTRDLDMAYRGGQHLVQMERADRYPGGRARRHDRLRILSQHLRPLTLDLLKHGNHKEAWELYGDTFMWNLSRGRLKYLVGFLFLAGLRGRR